jgi:uncharacterized membrane protein YedE/YeeE
MAILISLFVGLLFGLGLIVSGMGDPSKVIGFLDIAGNWDPSLALVMAGAIAIGLIAFRFAGRRTTSLLGMPMQLPTARRIDLRLLLGSALFGTGWGLSGICPGPAFVLAATDISKGSIFLIAMVAGMALFELQQGLQRRFSFA